jgi:hypothetical protein
MNYLNAMGKMLSLSPYRVSSEKALKRLQFYCILNVLVLGLIYGCSAALFSHMLLAQTGLAENQINLMKVVVAGIPTAFFMHAGAALFIWVFLKAMGGKSNFMISYFHIGAAAISLWPLAPFVALMQIGNQSGELLTIAGLLCAYAFAVNVQVIRQAFQLSVIRMTLATSVTLMYISCFLYLWV